MPSSTPKQERFMQIAAVSPDFARDNGIPQNVARDFASADRAERGQRQRGLHDTTDQPRGTGSPAKGHGAKALSRKTKSFTGVRPR